MAEDNWSYIGIFLTKESKYDLIKRVGKYVPEGWKTYAHHMTIAFNNGSEEARRMYDEYKDRFGEETTLNVTHLGKSEDAIAVKVIPNGTIHSLNKLTHITIAVPQGGKPVNSNYITEWEAIPTMELKGKIGEFEKRPRP